MHNHCYKVQQVHVFPPATTRSCVECTATHVRSYLLHWCNIQLLISLVQCAAASTSCNARITSHHDHHHHCLCWRQNHWHSKAPNHTHTIHRSAAHQHQNRRPAMAREVHRDMHGSSKAADKEKASNNGNVPAIHSALTASPAQPHPLCDV
jgi:hypothetical protein